jgi:hypothetical protein
MSTPQQDIVEKAHIYEELREFLRRQPDMTVSKIIGGWVFEPLNCFDPKPGTRLKPEVLIALIYLFLMGIVFAAFNLQR